MISTRALVGSLLVALGGGVVWSQLPHGHGAFFPQFRRQLRDQLWARVSFAMRDDPAHSQEVAPATMPKPAALPSVAVFRSALAAGRERPGATAFRADTELYCEHNRKAVEEQARKEGLSVGEVKELTFFGFAALRATQREKVEEVLGHPLADDQQQRLEGILQKQNEGFTASMRRAVDEGATEEQRWAIIHGFEQQFVDELHDGLGISAADFDRILAPDPGEIRGAMAVPLPAHVQPPPAASPSPSPATAAPRGTALTAAPPPGAGH